MVEDECIESNCKINFVNDSLEKGCVRTIGIDFTFKSHKPDNFVVSENGIIAAAAVDLPRNSNRIRIFPLVQNCQDREVSEVSEKAKLARVIVPYLSAVYVSGKSEAVDRVKKQLPDVKVEFKENNSDSIQFAKALFDAAKVEEENLVSSRVSIELKEKQRWEADRVPGTPKNRKDSITNSTFLLSFISTYLDPLKRPLIY